MRKEQIDAKRLFDKSLLFGVEPYQDYKGHTGQEVINVVENVNNQ